MVLRDYVALIFDPQTGRMTETPIRAYDFRDAVAQAEYENGKCRDSAGVPFCTVHQVRPVEQPERSRRKKAD